MGLAQGSGFPSIPGERQGGVCALLLFLSFCPLAAHPLYEADLYLPQSLAGVWACHLPLITRHASREEASQHHFLAPKVSPGGRA